MTEQNNKPEATATQKLDKTIEKSVTDGESLLDRVMNVLEDVMKAKMADFEKKVDDKIDTILKSKEIEVEHALRKGFGVENDPVIHMSDLVAYGRKSALETAETGKRTPTAETPAGPEGNVELSPVDTLFEKAKKGELA